MAFDQTAVFVGGFEYGHLFLRQRILGGAFQIGNILTFMNREGDGYLPSLNGPLKAYNRGMVVMIFSDFHKLRHMDIGNVISSGVAVRAAGAADGTKTDGLDALT